MKIHRIQTGTVRVKNFQLYGGGGTLSRFYQLLFTQKWSEWVPIYCWLIEDRDQLTLVDAGETADIYKEVYLPKGGLYHKAVQTRIKEEDELPHQLKKLGFDIKDIKSVVFTHMHGDHIGGLKYLKHANIYVSRKEYEFAISSKGPGAGYFKANWPDWFEPILVDFGDPPVGTFSKSFALTDNITLVPTPGHTAGHLSAIVTSKSQTCFIAGDVTLNPKTLESGIPNVILPNQVADKTMNAVRQYIDSSGAVFLSSHDDQTNSVYT